MCAEGTQPVDLWHRPPQALNDKCFGFPVLLGTNYFLCCPHEWGPVPDGLGEGQQSHQASLVSVQS